MTHSQIRQRFSKGLAKEEVVEILNTFGKCQTEVPVKPIINLLLEEFIGVFNVFQLFAIVVWFMDAYATYAIIIFIMTVIGIVMAIYETRKNQNNLNSMSMYSCEVTVHRNYNKHEIESLIINHKKEVVNRQNLNGSLHTDCIDDLKDSDLLDPENRYNENFSFITNSEE